MFRNFLKSYQDVWKVTTLDVYILEEKKEPFVPSDVLLASIFTPDYSSMFAYFLPELHPTGEFCI